MKNPNGYGSVFKLTGNRRKPWCARITAGWTDTGKQKYKCLGYFEKRQDAILTLAEYNKNPWDLDSVSITFEELFYEWVKSQENKMQPKNLSSYKSAFKNTEPIWKMKFVEIKKLHLQNVIDSITKGHSTKAKTKQVFSKLYQFAIENDITDKDYSQFVEIPTNTEKTSRVPFSMGEIKRLRDRKNDYLIDTTLILLYTGMRIGELLDIKCANVYLDQNYMVGGSKTKAGKNRIIPISKFIKPFIEKWYDPKNEYLIYRCEFKKFTYDAYLQWWKRNIENHNPHDTRHTFATLMDKIGANKIATKRILGHASDNVTDEVYTHKDVDDLLAAVNQLDEYIEKVLR